MSPHTASRRNPHLELLEDRCVPVVPALSSLPGAPATLYLDFNGHYESAWGSYRNINTPAYDRDGNPNAFSGAELNVIREVWERVAEDFAPFRLNVTTVDPGRFGDRQALRVVIGATNGFPAGVGGLAFVESFTNASPNVVYVLPHRLGQEPHVIATAVAHEAGHAFGLRHQSRYNSSGSKIDEYYSGDRLRAPIMGDAYDAQRSVWWSGPNDRSAASTQDDMAVLARSANGFGFRPDDHADNYRSATPLGGSSVRAVGLVGRTTDQDWFTFTTTGGTVNLAVQVARVGSNLDAVLELYRVHGSTSQRITLSAPGNSLGANLSASVAAGTYYAVVRSQGAYGDVGTYTLTGSVPGGSSAAPARTPARDAQGQFSQGTSGGGQGGLAATAATGETRVTLDKNALDLLYRRQGVPETSASRGC